MFLGSNSSEVDAGFGDTAYLKPNVAEALGALTFAAIALGRHDSLRSAHPPTRLGRFLAQLFGIEIAAPLADPKLEAVRRYCILFRHRNCLAPLQRGELSDHGYTPIQLAMIEHCLV